MLMQTNWQWEELTRQGPYRESTDGWMRDRILTVMGKLDQDRGRKWRINELRREKKKNDDGRIEVRLRESTIGETIGTTAT